MVKMDMQRPLPGVEVRMLDRVFGRQVVDSSVLGVYADVDSDVIVHCLTHGKMETGPSWNWAKDAASSPQNWCDGCKPVYEAHRQAADEHQRMKPLTHIYGESDADYQVRLQRYRRMARRRYPADIEVALEKATDLQLGDAHGLCEPIQAVVLAMIEARYGHQDRELITALVNRRLVERVGRVPVAAVELVRAARADTSNNFHGVAHQLAATLNDAGVAVPVVELGLVGTRYTGSGFTIGTYSSTDTRPWTGDAVTRLERLMQAAERARAVTDSQVLR